MSVPSSSLLIRNPIAVMSGRTGDAARLGRPAHPRRPDRDDCARSHTAARRTRDRRDRLRRLPGLGQHASPPVPEPAEGRAGRDQRRPAGMARGRAVSARRALHAGTRAHRRTARLRGAAAVRRDDLRRSSLPVSRGRHDRDRRPAVRRSGQLRDALRTVPRRRIAGGRRSSGLRRHGIAARDARPDACRHRAAEGALSRRGHRIDAARGRRPDDADLLAAARPAARSRARRARDGLRLHSHLSETTRYVDFCRERYGKLPVEFVAEHEWLGPDVWFAHLVHLEANEIALLAETGTGCSHCPVSNARLGSGIAPAPRMAAAGVPVSLGVDGVASNESGSMTHEANFAWLVHRAAHGAAATTAEEVLHWGTQGGARVLGLNAVGTLEPGRRSRAVRRERAALQRLPRLRNRPGCGRRPRR